VDVSAAIAAEIAALPKRDTPSVRAVRRRWSKTLKARPAAEILAAAHALEAQAGQGGKWIGYELIRFHPGAFAAVGEGEAADYASRCASWYAVDAFGTILAGPLWAEARIGDALVESWSKSADRWLRRLALVATVGAKADAARTLPICLRLAGDRDDMVEKAMSWALRELSRRDRPAVEAFVTEQDAILAARVKREVRNKLSTGLKTPRNRNMVTTA
jgi:3-methyladenine DNA glycosylase AlkD